MKIFLILFLFFNLRCLVCDPVFSQWNANPALNTPVSVQAFDQQDERIISDMKGGAIIVWEDFRNDSIRGDVYVQRISSSGYPLWTLNGVNICTNDSDQGTISIKEDGFGGAILCWNDHRSGNRDIYAQRVDSSGNVLWQTNGVPVCVKPFDQTDSKIVSDGSGGAIVVWQDSSLLSKWDIYAQRVSGNGVVMWPAVGQTITIDGASQRSPRIREDGNGGAIIVWQDKLLGDFDIRAKRIDSLGGTVWGGTYGIPVCAAPRGQFYPRLETDGMGGAIIAWQDKRNMPNGIDSIYDIYAQRVNASGSVQWTMDGIPVNTSTGTQDILDMAPDGVNGVFLVWKDFRNGNDFDIYAQRVNPAGNILWTPNGAPVDTSPYDQASPSITGDGNGGAIIAFRDSGGISGDDISSVKIDGIGTIQWKSPIGIASRKQDLPRVVSDGAGGGIYVFMDKRDTLDWDIYAHHLFWNGTENGIHEEVSCFTSRCFPNPFSSSARVEFESANYNEVEFSVWSLIGSKVEIPFSISQNDITISRGNLRDGIYFYEIRIGENSVSKGKLILTTE